MISTDFANQVSDRKGSKSQACIMYPEDSTQSPARQERERAEPELVREYRRVGPAAINAALLCRPKKKEEPKRSYEPHEEI
jgi:hypothetical protein